MHLDGFGKANGPPRQAFDPRAQREMSPLQLLRPPLADYMLVWSQMPLISAPAIGVKAANAEWVKQRFEFQEGLILTPAEDICQYPTRSVIERPPEPLRLCLAADE